jgi:FkbM family methyltransferase
MGGRWKAVGIGKESGSEMAVAVVSSTKHIIPVCVVALLLCLAACSDPPPRVDIVGTETKLYSQKNEEIIIRDFFQDRRDGFFLDIGCAWPKRNNNTYYLEHHLGWSGIGVDALVEHAPAWAAMRPRSKFFGFLVTDHSDTEDDFYRAAWPGRSSREKDQRGRQKMDFEQIQVQTITLDKLLELNGVSKIDLLSMDIEGAQKLALAGFDIEKYQPELVCIEKYWEDQQDIFRYFEEHGYERIERYNEYDEYNVYFTPRG